MRGSAVKPVSNGPKGPLPCLDDEPRACRLLGERRWLFKRPGEIRGVFIFWYRVRAKLFPIRLHLHRKYLALKRPPEHFSATQRGVMIESRLHLIRVS